MFNMDTGEVESKKPAMNAIAEEDEKNDDDV